MDEDPSYDIAIREDVGAAPGRPELLRRAIAAVLRRHDVPAAVISVAVVSDETIAGINQAYLGHEGPTDVITFDLREADGDPLNAELVLSHDTAAREAAARGIAVEAELALYAVHGALHLCGYDDHAPEDASHMHAVEDAVLMDLGLGPVYSGGVP